MKGATCSDTGCTARNPPQNLYSVSFIFLRFTQKFYHLTLAEKGLSPRNPGRWLDLLGAILVAYGKVLAAFLETDYHFPTLSPRMPK